MEEEDKVGEIDFEFDVSEWMVLDDDAADDVASIASDVDHNEKANSHKQTKSKKQNDNGSERSQPTELVTKTSPAPTKKQVTASATKAPSKTLPAKKASTPLKVKSQGTGKKSPAQNLDKKGTNNATKVSPAAVKKLVSTENKSGDRGKTSFENEDSSNKSPPTSHTQPKKSIKADVESSLKNSSSGNTMSETLKTSTPVTKDQNSMQKQQSATTVMTPKASNETKIVKDVKLSKTTTVTTSTPKTTNVTSCQKPKLATSGSGTPKAKLVKKSRVASEKQPLVKPKSIAPIEMDNEFGSLAQVMKVVDKQNQGDTYDDDMEDISDTEWIINADIPNVSTNGEKPEAAGGKRKLSSYSNEPGVKKAKVTSVRTKKSSLTSAATPKTEITGAKKSVKQPNATKTQISKSQSALVSKVKKGVEKTKVPAPSTIPATPVVGVDTKTQGQTPNSTPVKKTVKRIVRRFHRTTQTEVRQSKSKLLQCLIRIPSLDASPKSMRDQCEQTICMEEKNLDLKDTVYYQMPLPDTLHQDVFRSVAAFSVNKLGHRKLGTVSFPYGISFGPVSCADIDKNSFRENILRKSDYYNTFFDAQDFGVVDLLFLDEENFSSMITQIRKTRIGSRHLVVTFCKNLAVEERDSDTPVPEGRATVIFDQNFSSAGFLKFQKAPIWNKPKVEEIVTIHNVPGGIPLDFLKLLIPDAITMEVDKEECKFTKDNSRLCLGMTRKDGSDFILKLFCQLFVNNECVVLTKSSAEARDLPELKEILSEKDQRQREEKMKADLLEGRELTAVARDINKGLQEVVDQNDKAEVIMHVENMEETQTVLTGRASAWKGPSSTAHLKQVLQQQKKQIVNKSSDLALSDVSLSDISDISDFDEKHSPLTRYPLKAELPSRRSLSHGRRAASRSSRGNRSSRSRQSAKKGTWHGTVSHERADERRNSRPKDSSPYGFPSRRSLDRDIQWKQSTRQERDDNDSQNLLARRRDDRDGSDRRRDSYGTDGGANRYNRSEDGSASRYDRSEDGHRTEGSIKASMERREEKAQKKEVTEDYWSARAVLRRERLEIEAKEKARKEERMKWAAMKKDKQNKPRSERIDRQDTERQRASRPGSDTDRSRNTHSVDLFTRLSQNTPDSVDRYAKEGYRSRDRIRYSSQERPSSLHRRIGGGDDERRVVRARSPLTCRIVRGRSVSPRKSQSPTRRRSETFRKVIVGRRSASPRTYPRGSTMSPISVGDETEVEDPKKDRWSSKQQDLRKAGSGQEASSNLVSLKADRTNFGDTEEASEADKSAFRAQLESFIKEAIALSRESNESQGSSNRPQTTQYNSDLSDPVKFLEKMKDAYGSGVNFTDSGSGTGTSIASNTIAAGQGRVGLKQHAGSFPPQDLSVPPPIPPPVAPPLFTPEVSAQDRISQMEALAKQLAADIQKQQPNDPQGGMWCVPPPNLAQRPPPSGALVTNPVHLQGPPVMPFPGHMPFQRQLHPMLDHPPPIQQRPNLGLPPDMRNPPPAPWPPGNFF